MINDSDLPPLPKLFPVADTTFTMRCMTDEALRALQREAFDAGMRSERNLKLAAAPQPPANYHPSGNWPEDFAGENGQYENACNGCGAFFIGNKHRRTCKDCAPKPPASTELEIDERSAHAEMHQLAIDAGFPSQNTGSIEDDTHLRSLFGNMHPLSIECIISYVKENHIDTRTAALVDAASKERGGDAGARDVLAERQRQKEVEGWTAEHDDAYKFKELATAAICYIRTNRFSGAIDVPVDSWPWPHEWWKPTTPRRNLVKAGALILAEIERLDRAAIATTKAAK